MVQCILYLPRSFQLWSIERLSSWILKAAVTIPVSRDRKLRKLTRVWNIAYINPANWSCWMFRGSKVSVSDAHALERNDDNEDPPDNAEQWFKSDVLIATRRQTRHLSFVLRVPRRDTFSLLWKRTLHNLGCCSIILSPEKMIIRLTAESQSSL